MVQAAFQVSLAYFIIVLIDPYLLSWQALNRPIVVAPIAGLILGDIGTGIVMGAALESIFMGISAIGGQIPADATTSSIIAVAFTVLTGASAEAGLALALPIGTVMASFAAMLTPLWGMLAPYWEKLAVSGNTKSFNIQVILFTMVPLLANAIVLFISVAYGVEGLNSFLATLPPWVMRGLGAASGMMLAIGFAILTSMIWSNEVGIFFFLGYVLVKYLNLGTLPIAIIGAVIAVALFFQEKRVVDVKAMLLHTKQVANDEEDFF